MTKEDRLDLKRDVTLQVRSVGDTYGMDAIPENVQRRLDAIVTAPTEEEALRQAQKAPDSMEIACLAAWSRGKIAGPDSPEALERRAKQAESLVAMFNKRGDQENADKQLARAAALRRQGAQMLEQQKQARLHTPAEE